MKINWFFWKKKKLEPIMVEPESIVETPVKLPVEVFKELKIISNHRTFVKRDIDGNVLATIRILPKTLPHLPHDFEEIDDDHNIGNHVKYYSKKE